MENIAITESFQQNSIYIRRNSLSCSNDSRVLCRDLCTLLFSFLEAVQLWQRMVSASPTPLIKLRSAL